LRVLPFSGEVVFWTAMQQYVSKFIEQRPSMTREETIFFRYELRTKVSRNNSDL